MSAALADAIAYLEEEADRLDAEIAGNRIRAAKIRAGVACLRDALHARPSHQGAGTTYTAPAVPDPLAAATIGMHPDPAVDPDEEGEPTSPVAVEELTPAPVDGIPGSWRTGGARERILAVLADRGPTRTTELVRFTDCPNARTAMALKVALRNGEIARPELGVYVITDLGRQVLAQVPPPPVSDATVAAYEEPPSWRDAPTRRRVLRAIVALGSVTREQLVTILNVGPKTITTATVALRDAGHVELRRNGTTNTFHPTADGVRADQDPLPGRGQPRERRARPSERTPSTTRTPIAEPAGPTTTKRIRDLMADGRARTTDDIAARLNLPISTIRSSLTAAGLIRGGGRHAGYWRAPRTGTGIPLDTLGPIERRPIRDIAAARTAAALAASGGGTD